jgi:hypothetical protein
MSQPRPAARARHRALTILLLALATSAIGGALLAGASVSWSVSRAWLERIGRSDVVVEAPRFVRERLVDDLTADGEFAGAFEAAAPMIVLRGVAGDAAGTRRVPDVEVFGVDDRFWRFHAVADVTGPAAGDVVLTAALADALGASEGTVVRIETEDAADAPLESLHGRKDDLAVSLPLTVRRVLASSGPGVFSLRPPSGPALAAFVSLGLLQRDPSRRGAVNTLLLSAKNGSAAPASILRSSLARHLTPADAGLDLRMNEAVRRLTVESRTGFIGDTVADMIANAAIETGALPTTVMTTVVSAIRSRHRTLSYSFVTSVELQEIAPDVHSEETEHPAIVLNDWTARQLQVAIGDPLTLEYPVWVSPGRVETHTAGFEVVGVVPMSGQAADPSFAPRLPGITGAPAVRAWMPRFPFDRQGIAAADEEYWSRYGSTPKAFVVPQVGRALWRTRAGVVTSVRIAPPEGVDLAVERDRLAARVGELLDPDALGIAAHEMRSDIAAAAPPGSRAAIHAVPLALALLLLMSLWASRGWHPTQAAAVTAAGTALGIAGAFLLCVVLLRTATFPPGGGLHLHVSATALAACLIVGLIAALALWMSPAWRRRDAVVGFCVIAAVAAAGLAYDAWRHRTASADTGIHGGTGGFALAVRTTFPIVRDPASPEGVAQLGLSTWPNVRATPLRLHDGDDLSRPGLVRQMRPRIVGVSRELIDQGRFGFTASLDRSDEERDNPWLLLEREQRDPDDPGAAQGAPIVPVIAGARAAAAAFNRGLGDDIVIQAAGQPVRLRIVATLADSLLDDALVMSDAHFTELFPDDEGYRMLLVEAPAAVAEVTAQLGGRLRSAGVDVEPAAARLDRLRRAASSGEHALAAFGGLAMVTALSGVFLAWRTGRS